jgi:hypothetical protein
MSELFTKRALFSSLIPRLIDRMIADGYTPLLGKDGLHHMVGSLHFEGLAEDIDLFKNGVYLDKTDDHRPFGEFWEGLHPDCRWGGRFSPPDGNHYSVTSEGKS